jgi:ERF superfamily
MNELSKALVKAQAAMSHAAKDSKNPHFKFAYSSLASVIDAVRPHLAGNGLAFVQMLHTADGGVAVETVLIHESGEQLSCGTLFIPASKQDAQGYGSAITYAKRYGLQAALGIASEDDDGTAAVKTPPKPVEKPVGIELDHTIAKMASAVSYESLKDIFRAAWTICLKEQQIPLKAAYDQFKANWENQ